MAEVNSTTINPGKEVEENCIEITLWQVIESSFFSIEAFYQLLKEYAGEDEQILSVLQVLKPLLERQEADLKKIEKVIFRTLGEIKILKCREFTQFNGKNYFKGDYFKAILEPPDKAEEEAA